MKNKPVNPWKPYPKVSKKKKQVWCGTWSLKGEWIKVSP